MSSTYILAVIGFLILVALYELWQCRLIILAKLAASLQEGEVQTNIIIDIEAASRQFMHSTEYVGTPEHVIISLPVFKYTTCSRHVPTSRPLPKRNCGRQPEGPSGDGTGTCISQPRHQQQIEHAHTPSRSSDPSHSVGHDGTPGHIDIQQQPSRDQLDQPQQLQQQVSCVIRLIQQPHQQQRQLPTIIQAASAAQAFIDSDNTRDQHMQEPQVQLPAHQHHIVDHDSTSMSSQDSYDACVICLSSYESDDLLKQLPCKHIYHTHCLDEWLHRSNSCPLCKCPAWQQEAGTAEAVAEDDASASAFQPRG